MNTKSATKTEELRPCPFCGEIPKVNNWTFIKGITEKRCFCDNENCPVYLSKTIAIDDWNTRPIEDALRARIAELEAEVTKGHELQDSYCDRIAELEAAQRWIPVGERLPEKGNLVIGITDYCGYVFFEIVDDDGQGIVLHPYQRRQGKVTHWMPLPELPEVNNVSIF